MTVRRNSSASRRQALMPATLDDSKLKNLRLEFRAVGTAFENAFGRVFSRGLTADDPDRMYRLTAGR